MRSESKRAAFVPAPPEPAQLLAGAAAMRTSIRDAQEHWSGPWHRLQRRLAERSLGALCEPAARLRSRFAPAPEPPTWLARAHTELSRLVGRSR